MVWLPAGCLLSWVCAAWGTQQAVCCANTSSSKSA